MNDADADAFGFPIDTLMILSYYTDFIIPFH